MDPTTRRGLRPFPETAVASVPDELGVLAERLHPVVADEVRQHTAHPGRHLIGRTDAWTHR